MEKARQENKSFFRRHLALSIILIIIFLAVIFAVVAVYYIMFYSPNTESGENIAKNLANPAQGLTNEEAVMRFDKSFVNYLLYNIGAYELHNSPLSGETPKIKIRVSGQIYFAVIDNGVINVQEQDGSGEDIILTTTKEEAVMMMKDKAYIEKSFLDGKSSADLVADKTTLLAKGYIGLYQKLTGKSI